jgi:EmrB/QacA subfamily drug resistance transporter
MCNAAPVTATAGGATIGLSARRLWLVFVGLQLGMMLSSLDNTIVATALPTISRELGGFSRLSWVVTAYFLAQVASMPLFGKLGDLYGRKKLVLIAVTLFVVGSLACGAAQSIDQLIAFRFVQGLGAGGIGPLSMAIVADVVPARQLGRWLGYQGALFAVASVAGPLVGGLFVDQLSWRWAFYVNIPIAAAGLAIIGFGLHLPYRRIPHAIDYLGSALLVGALTCLVLLVSGGGESWAWASFATAALAVGALGLGGLFLARQRRAPEPVLPLRLFADRVTRATLPINFGSGFVLLCGVFFLPVFLQEVAGVSPFESGLLLAPMMFGAAIGTLVAGRRVERTGRYRRWPVIGSVLMTVGLGLLATLQESTPVALAIAFGGILGLGVGFVMQTSLLAVQNSVEHRDLGTATSTALLFRLLGPAVGTPIFGAVLNAGLGDGPRTASAFADALPWVFVSAIPVGIATFLVSLRLEERPLREHAHFGPDTIDVPFPVSPS